MNKRKPNKLTMRDSFRLINWLKDNQNMITAKTMNPGAVARWAGQQLEIHLTDNNITGAMGPSDSAPIQYMWPRTRIHKIDSITPIQYKLLFEMVELVCAELNIEPEGELRETWHKVREQLGIALPPLER